MQYKRFKLSGLGWLNNLKAEKGEDLINKNYTKNSAR
jgi:hypothetical protein